jgi:hypothetical protein
MKRSILLKISFLLLVLWRRNAVAQDTNQTLTIICGRFETVYIKNRIVYVPDYWRRNNSSFRRSFWQKLDEYAVSPFRFLDKVFSRNQNDKASSLPMTDSIAKRCSKTEISHFIKCIPLTQAQFAGLRLRRRHLFKNMGELRVTVGLPPCVVHYNLYAWPCIPVYLNGTEVKDSLLAGSFIKVLKVRRRNPLFGAAHIEVCTE